MNDEERQLRSWLTGQHSGHSGESPMPLEARISRLASRRSRAACGLCRWRKVRCDGEKGQSCSNCIFENVECIVPPKQDRSRAHPRKPYPGPSASSGNADNRQTTTPTDGLRPAESPSSPGPSMRPADQSHSLIAAPSRAARAGDSYGMSQLDQNDDTTNAPTPRQPKEGHGFNWFAAATQSVPSLPSPQASAGLPPSGVRLSEASASAHRESLPPWLKPLPAHLSAEDLDYIRRKGGLAIPEPSLRDDLLKNYIEFVHPGLPLLDLASFQASLQDPARNGPISLLLFQAVMFASTPWASIKLVRSQGYWTRTAIRRAYYEKFKVLYDLSYERDRLVIVQALNLATIWWDGPSEQKDGYYYCNLALAVARSIGLHRDVHNQFLPPSVRKLRRRVWWSCLMRDTITSIGGNRSPRTKDADFTVPELTLEDFDIQSPSPPGTPWAISRDSQSQRQLALVFIWQSKLCRIMSHILELAYHENHMGHTGILYPRQDSDAIGDGCAQAQSPSALTLEKLKACEDRLSQWRKEVPETVLHESPPPMLDVPHEQAPYVHRALLSMLYFVAMFSLHRPYIKASGLSKPTEVCGDGQSASPHQKMRYAAACGNKIVMELYQADLMRSLPATGIGCILAISFSHVFDLQSDPEARREGIRRLEECKQALRELVEAHSAAEWAIKFLTTAAAYVTRIGNMRQKGMSSNQNVVLSEEPLDLRESQHGQHGSQFNEMQNNRPRSIIGRGSTSALPVSEPLQESGLQHWQRLSETLLMGPNDRSASSHPLILPEGSVEYPNFPDVWLSGISDPFDSFNSMLEGTGSFDDFL